MKKLLFTPRHEFFSLDAGALILAYQHASAAEISPFSYTVVIFSGLLGWIFFHDVPVWISVLGTLLICAGGIHCIEAGHP